VVSPQAKREAVTHLMVTHQFGVTRSCGLIGISRSLYRYESKRPDDTPLKERLAELAGQKRRYGYRRLHVLLRREGWLLNWKRTYRVYREAGLMVRRRKRKRIVGIDRLQKVIATAPNQSWSMDFVSDGFVDGRRLRCLNIVDDFTRECLAIEVDTSLPGRRVVSVLERLAEFRGLPQSVTVDNVLNASVSQQNDESHPGAAKERAPLLKTHPTIRRCPAGSAVYGRVSST
jgi:putative transposase